MKPRICLVADVPNWAFDSICQKLKKELSYKYDIRITYFNRRTEADDFYEFIEENSDHDLIHFLNRRILLLMGSKTFKEKVEKSGRNYKKYIKSIRKKISTAVYDYMDLDKDGILNLLPIYNKYSTMYYTATNKLFKIYNSIEEYKKPDAMIYDICDEEQFVPMNLNRFDYNNIAKRKLVIGWAGNSTHSGDTGNDLKGFNKILKPVIDELLNEGYELEENYADRNVNFQNPDMMPIYYSNIDIYICVSLHEGTPRTALEAMNCGVPMISTDVGLISDAFGKKQSEFIIGDREDGEADEEIKQRLKERIIYLYNNRKILKKLSEENLKSIKKFSGKKIAKEFEVFFDKCLSSQNRKNEIKS